MAAQDEPPVVVQQVCPAHSGVAEAVHNLEDWQRSQNDKLGKLDRKLDDKASSEDLKEIRVLIVRLFFAVLAVGGTVVAGIVIAVLLDVIHL